MAADGHRLAQAFGQRRGIVAIGAVAPDQELLAVQPGDEVGATLLRGQVLGNTAQHDVASRVNVHVVDALEVVDVDLQQQQPARRTGAGRSARGGCRWPSGSEPGQSRQPADPYPPPAAGPEDRLFKQPFSSRNTPRNTPRRALGHAPAWLLGAAAQTRRVNNAAVRWPMQATKAPAGSQRASSVIAALPVIATTFAMHAMVGCRSRQLKMQRPDAYCEC